MALTKTLMKLGLAGAAGYGIYLFATAPKVSKMPQTHKAPSSNMNNQSQEQSAQRDANEAAGQLQASGKNRQDRL